MVLFFPCLFGVKIPLLLGERFGQRIEIEALEFINAIPIEWRLGTPTDPITGWQESILERKSLAFHDLQRPNRSGGTRGTPEPMSGLKHVGSVMARSRYGSVTERSKLRRSDALSWSFCLNRDQS
jgi:hypothetical protein